LTDYWLDDGYVEFVSDDSVRSHIPRDALDLKKQSSKTLLLAFLLCFDPRRKITVERALQSGTQSAHSIQILKRSLSQAWEMMLDTNGRPK